MLRRTIAAAIAVLGLTLATAGVSLATSPQVYTWTNPVDVEYFDCGSFQAHGVWDISHRLTFFLDANGVATRDMEVVSFVGAFVNPNTGASIPDSGRVTYWDTLDADGNYLTTVSTVERHSAYFHGAGRTNFQTGTFRGLDKFDAGIPAACAALGA